MPVANVYGSCAITWESAAGFRDCRPIRRSRRGFDRILRDAGLSPEAKSKLANISTRGLVESGDNVMIGGFIAGGGKNRGLPR